MRTREIPQTVQHPQPRRIRGQGMTEYIIIVAMIAIAGITAASYFGDAVKAQFVSLGSELVGGADVDPAVLVKTSLGAAKTDASELTTLKNYKGGK